MQDPADSVTGDLLPKVASTRERQAAYKARQEAMGRRQRPLWLTDDELRMVKFMLERSRASQAEKTGSSR